MCINSNKLEGNSECQPSWWPKENLLKKYITGFKLSLGQKLEETEPVAQKALWRDIIGFFKTSLSRFLGDLSLSASDLFRPKRSIIVCFWSLSAKEIYHCLPLISFGQSRFNLPSFAISAEIFKLSIWARNRVGTGLSYRPARLHSLVELVPLESILGLLKSLKIRALLVMTTVSDFLHIAALIFRHVQKSKVGSHRKKVK